MSPRAITDGFCTFDVEVGIIASESLLFGTFRATSRRGVTRRNAQVDKVAASIFRSRNETAGEPQPGGISRWFERIRKHFESGGTQGDTARQRNSQGQLRARASWKLPRRRDADGASLRDGVSSRFG
jgi:hypothetical protein